MDPTNNFRSGTGKQRTSQHLIKINNYLPQTNSLLLISGITGHKPDFHYYVHVAAVPRATKTTGLSGSPPLFLTLSISWKVVVKLYFLPYSAYFIIINIIDDYILIVIFLHIWNEYCLKKPKLKRNWSSELLLLHLIIIFHKHKLYCFNFYDHDKAKSE